MKSRTSPASSHWICVHQLLWLNQASSDNRGGDFRGGLWEGLWSLSRELGEQPLPIEQIHLWVGWDWLKLIMEGSYLEIWQGGDLLFKPGFLWSRKSTAKTNGSQWLRLIKSPCSLRIWANTHSSLMFSVTSVLQSQTKMFCCKKGSVKSDR